MKRSEMVDIIKKDLINWTGLDHEMDDDQLLEVAEYILISVEKAGMLPPFNEKINAKDIISLRIDPYDSENYFVWELEDE